VFGDTQYLTETLMTRRTQLVAGGALAAALLIAAAGMAMANGNDGDTDAPLTGSDLDRATAAALEHVGGGTVIETEAGDDGAAYGVEIRRDDGTVVEVSLDESFAVINQQTDDDGADGADGTTDD
jgi:uncharacterized membrane protein YkoI